MMVEMIQIVKQLNEDFPGVEFTYGHLDNWYRGFDPEKDGCYYMFTQVPLKGERGSIPPRRFKFIFGNGTSVKHVQMTKSDSFLRWIDKVVNATGTDEYKWWYRRVHANDCPECGGRNYAIWGRSRHGREEKMLHCLTCDIDYPKAG